MMPAIYVRVSSKAQDTKKPGTRPAHLGQGLRRASRLVKGEVHRPVDVQARPETAAGRRTVVLCASTADLFNLHPVANQTRNP